MRLPILPCLYPGALILILLAFSCSALPTSSSSITESSLSPGNSHRASDSPYHLSEHGFSRERSKNLNKRTIHSFLALSPPGSGPRVPTWQFRCIQIASLIPVQVAVQETVPVYEAFLALLPTMDLSTVLVHTGAGTFLNFSIGDIILNFQSPNGRLERELIMEFVKLLRLAAVENGWVTQFKTEMTNVATGVVVYVAQSFASQNPREGIKAGPLKIKR